MVLTAPGPLAGVPWPMLPALRGRPVTLAPSATRWVHGRRGAMPRRAAFATGPSVRRGDEEVAAAARAWPGATILRGDAATVDAVTGLAAGASVLHIAAHGRHVADNPMFSALELADGALFGYDIDRMTAGTRHRGALGVRAGSFLGALGRRGGRDDPRLAARGLRERHRRPRRGRG